MKVSLVLPGRAISGGVIATATAANGLCDRGHQVRILWLGSSLVQTIKGGIFKLMYPSTCDGLKGFKGEIEKFTDITKCRFADDEIIVGTGLWASKQLGLLTSCRSQKLQYLLENGCWDMQLREEALSLPIPKIVVASFLTPIVESYGGDKVLAVVPNGVDQRRFYLPDCEAQRNGVGIIYGCHPAKDPETILAVMANLRESFPDVPVIIFGADRRHERIPKELYCRLPSVEQIRKLYSRCLVWVVASRTEGFSLPVLEAMACGCVVVSTDCGGPRDMIVDGENGFLVERENAHAIMKKVTLLLQDEELRTRLRLKSQETVKQFSWEKAIDKLEKVLLQMTEEHRGEEAKK